MAQRARQPVVGQPGPRFDDVARIAVLRGGGLGDLLFALPAITALAAAYPTATITLLGTPMHAALLAGRPGPVDSIEVLPVSPGVRDGDVEDPAAKAEFFDRMRAANFDLAVQVHGGGRNSNPFLLELGARHTVGTQTPDAAELERTVPYIYYQHEVLRALEVVGLAGALPVDLEPFVELSDDEMRVRDKAAESEVPLVLIHPGATDPRRRWPGRHFGEIAAQAAAYGAQVVVVGDASDADLADAIVEHARGRGAGEAVTSRAGQVPLASLVALLASATVLLANDSGPRHLAQAIGTPTVGIYWFGNVINAGPLSRAQHRVHLSWTTWCPVCGRDCTQVGWTAERCEHDESLVAEVGVDAVLDDVRDLMAKKVPPRGR